jgi:hypothetical protein
MLLIPRGEGRGTILLGLFGLLGPGIGPDTVPGNLARGGAQRKPLAKVWPGLMVATAPRRALSVIPRTCFGCPSTAEGSAHG